jgi:hypothetical protein
LQMVISNRVASDGQPPPARRVNEVSERSDGDAPQLNRRRNTASRDKVKARRVRMLQEAELQVQRKKAAKEVVIDVLEQTRILARICKRFNQFCSSLLEAARAEHTIVGTIAPMDDEEGLT